MTNKEYRAKINNLHYCNHKNAICPDCDPFNPDCEACSLKNESSEGENRVMEEVI